MADRDAGLYECTCIRREFDRLSGGADLVDVKRIGEVMSGRIWPKEGARRLWEAQSDRATIPPEVETTLSIGNLNPSLWVVPFRHTHPAATDFWDGNWIDAQVTVHAGMFHGEFLACLRSDELARFRDDINALLENKTPRAQYHSMERWLEIDLTLDKSGHAKAKCSAGDYKANGNRLNFAIETDRADIEALAGRLNGWLKFFPVVGKPTE